MTIIERLRAAALWANVLANGCTNLKTSTDLKQHADNLREIMADIDLALKEIADRRQQAKIEVGCQEIATS